MSTETAATKKSFLTRLMEIADRGGCAEYEDGCDEYEDHPAVIADNKKYAKIAVAATVGTVAALALSWKTLSKMAPVEEETSENATSED